MLSNTIIERFRCKLQQIATNTFKDNLLLQEGSQSDNFLSKKEEIKLGDQAIEGKKTESEKQLSLANEKQIECYQIVSEENIISIENSSALQKKQYSNISNKEKNILQRLPLESITDPQPHLFKYKDKFLHTITPEHFTGDFSVTTPNIQIVNKNLKLSPLVLPPLACINNLLSLSHVISSENLKIEIKRLSVVYQISFTRLLIIYGIQKLVQLFYEEHDIELDVNQQYLYQKVGQYFCKFFQTIVIKNWFVLRRILRGFLNRFGSLRFYHDAWLEGCLKKKRSILQKTGINVSNILQTRQYFIKNNGIVDYEKFITDIEEPKNCQSHFIDYKEKYPQLGLQEIGKQLMHDPQQTRVHNKLRYYQEKLVHKRQHEKNLKEQALVLTGKSDQEAILTFTRQPMLLLFELSMVKASLPADLSCILTQQDKKVKQIFIPCARKAVQKQDRQIINNKQSKKLEEESAISINSSHSSKKSKSQKIKEKIIKKSKEFNAIPEKLKIPISNSNKIIRKTIKAFEIQDSSSNCSYQFKKQQNKEIVISDDESSNLNQKPLNQQQKILNEMQRRIQLYFKRKPDFNLKQLRKEMENILNDLGVSKKEHDTICSAWLKKFN